MSEINKSRRFWEKVILVIEVTMFLGFAFVIYFTFGILINLGFNPGEVTAVFLQILFTLVIIYANKQLIAELNRRLPIPKRNYYAE